MYALMNVEWEIEGLYSNIHVALMNLYTSPYALTLINNVTGEVIYNNFDK